jgi:hypothetical protein
VTQFGRSFLGIDDQNGCEIFSDLRGFGYLSFVGKVDLVT